MWSVEATRRVCLHGIASSNCQQTLVNRPAISRPINQSANQSLSFLSLSVVMGGVVLLHLDLQGESEWRFYHSLLERSSSDESYKRQKAYGSWVNQGSYFPLT